MAPLPRGEAIRIMVDFQNYLEEKEHTFPNGNRENKNYPQNNKKNPIYLKFCFQPNQKIKVLDLTGNQDDFATKITEKMCDSGPFRMARERLKAEDFAEPLRVRTAPKFHSQLPYRRLSTTYLFSSRDLTPLASTGTCTHLYKHSTQHRHTHKRNNKVKDWRDGSEAGSFGLLSQRTWVQSASTTWRFTPLYKSRSWKSNALLWPPGHCTHYFPSSFPIYVLVVSFCCLTALRL